jgi:hypothetical protein
MNLTTKKNGFEHYTLTFTYINSAGAIVDAIIARWSIEQLEADLVRYCYKHNLSSLAIVSKFKSLKKGI